MRQRDNGKPERNDGRYVLYWMTSSRRLAYNFALDRAVARARALDLPLLVFEPLRAGYRFASDRHHRFIVDGMSDNKRRAQEAGVGYFPYVEVRPGDGRGLLEALAARATVVVGDDNVGFFYPRMLDAAMCKLDVRLELVDSNGLLPVAATDRTFTTAYSFRRHLQKTLLSHLVFPEADPLCATLGAPRLPNGILNRWPRADLSDPSALIAAVRIDHSVKPVDRRGGPVAGTKRLEAFVASGAAHNSGLSPYLHFGHVGSHQVFAAVTGDWSPGDVADVAHGSRSGWWGLDENRERFLDELITWRELGVNGVATMKDCDSYDTLPDWARATLEQHSDDPRTYIYLLDQLEAAETHDEVWNAAQRELLVDGTIDNYLRMLWGKKILEWSPHPREALAAMLALNDKYAIDGRDPNSISGIFWILGRYDRAWGPERSIFGKVRYMSSENTKRKKKLGPYLERYSAPR